MSTLLGALGIVFIAELGDKTQLVALGLGARHRLAPVIGGMVLAYTFTTGLSVLIGELADAAFPVDVVSGVVGLLFIGFAFMTLRGGGDAAEAGATMPARSGRAVLLSVAATMTIAELGDKTMLATATLAARGSAILVWIGAAIGITAAGLVGVLLGRTIGARVPERVIRLGSAALFAVFGVALVVSALT